MQDKEFDALQDLGRRMGSQALFFEETFERAQFGDKGIVIGFQHPPGRPQERFGFIRDKRKV